MRTPAQQICARYRVAHNEMRNIDGLQPQEALDELLKYLFFKECDEEEGILVPEADPFATIPALTGVAQDIRARFRKYVRAGNGLAKANWAQAEIKLSELALYRVHCALQAVSFRDTPVDIRSAALREFLSPEMRKGLGIFLTPEDVVSEIVAAMKVPAGATVLDPACGSGTFLIEAARQATPNGKLRLYGIDKNPKMLMLAELNMGHQRLVRFSRALADSLKPYFEEGLPPWYGPNKFDFVLTNPPFGVTADSRAHEFGAYATCEGMSAQVSEVLFTERSIDALKPGGRMAIVLPRSVATNPSLEKARKALGATGFIRAVVTLPSETFAATGTQTTTVVLVIEKYGAIAKGDLIEPVVARIENVGFDATGRVRAGSELRGLGEALFVAMDSRSSVGLAKSQAPIPAKDTFVRLPELVSGVSRRVKKGDKRLASLLEFATTGATPSRSAYSESGLFLVKVGNLTGAGISWIARERNFVESGLARYNRPDRLLQPGDILLTSSAHAPRYIAKKIDIVTSVPSWVGGRASFVGEVMILRPKHEVDAFRLLAYLRLEPVVHSLQNLIRGQTAHLHPEDVLRLPVRDDLWNDPAVGTTLVELVTREAQLNDELNDVAHRQIVAQGGLSGGLSSGLRQVS